MINSNSHLVSDHPGHDPPAVLAAGRQETEKKGKKEKKFDVVAAL